MSLMAASARNVPPVGSRHWELQEFAQRGCPGVVHGRVHSHLGGFQIEAPRLTAAVEDDAQQLDLLRERLPGGSLPPFFFLRRLLGLLQRPQTAERSIDLDQFAGQRLKPPELGDLRFGLAHGCWGGKILRSGLPADLLGELKVRTMSRVIGFGAMTPRFSAAASGAGDGTWLEVAEFGDLSEQRGSVVNQGGKRISHAVLLLTVFRTLRFGPQKRKPSSRHFHVAHPMACRTLTGSEAIR
jgi:hypothetical protein